MGNDKLRSVLAQTGFAVAAIWAVAAGAAPPTPSSPGTVQSTVPGQRIEAPVGLPAEIDTSAQKPQSKVAPGGTPIQVTRIVVTGNTQLSEEEIKSVTAAHEGKSLTLAQVYEVADQLTALYRARGYAVATATVPPQKIATGEVRLEVIEGAIGEVVTAGNEKYSNEFIRGQLDELRDGDILTIDSMEREMLLLNDLPGLAARSVIRPGSRYGTSQILVNTEEAPVEGYLRTTNHGREDVGDWRAEGGVLLNNPAGIGDQLSLDLMHSESNLLNYFKLGYTVAANTSGTRIGFGYSEVDFDVAGAFKALGINGDSKIAELRMTHPLIRSRNRNLLVGMGAFNKRSESVVSLIRDSGVSSGRITDAELNAFDFSVLLSQVHQDNSVSNLSAVFWTNFRKRDAADDDLNPVDGLAPDDNRLRAKLQIDANHLRALPWWNLQLFLRAAGVLSADPLVDSEKYGIGGPADVRGFPISELRGDDGGSVTLEFRKPFDIGRLLNLAHNMPASAALFWDGGVVHRKKPAAGFRNSDSLTSVGAGLAVLPMPRLQIDLSVAKPLNSLNLSDGADSGRVWANVTTRF